MSIENLNRFGWLPSAGRFPFFPLAWMAFLKLPVCETSPTGYPSTSDAASSAMCPAGQACGFAVLLC